MVGKHKAHLRAALQDETKKRVVKDATPQDLRKAAEGAARLTKLDAATAKKTVRWRRAR